MNTFPYQPLYSNDDPIEQAKRQTEADRVNRETNRTLDTRELINAFTVLVKRKPTKKAFREHLNKVHPLPLHRNGPYHQRTRAYGDYLYAQDKERFDIEYKEWRDAGGDT